VVMPFYALTLSLSAGGHTSFARPRARPKRCVPAHRRRLAVATRPMSTTMEALRDAASQTHEEHPGLERRPRLGGRSLRARRA